MSTFPGRSWSTAPLARTLGKGRSRVGPIELLFDLVYVFAIIQLSYALLGNLSWRGAAGTAVLFGAVWWAWNYTAWAMNWLDPDRAPVWVFNAVLMVAGLGMSIAMPQAFGEAALLFAACYVFAQIARPVFMMVAFRGTDLSVCYRALLGWSAIAAVLWIAGAAASPEWRLPIWAAALAIDYIAPRLDFRLPVIGGAPMEKWDTDAEHLTERNQLVYIIALGETILMMGFTLSRMEVLTTTAMIATLIGWGALFVQWWNYFALGWEDAGHERHAGTGELRDAYAYAHTLMVAGAIVVAVSVGLLLSDRRLDAAIVLTGTGGPLLYLIGNVLFLRSRIDALARSRYIAAAALAAIAGVGLIHPGLFTPNQFSLVVLAVMTALAIYTQRRKERLRT